jgi:hypothetical protein
MPPRGIKKGTKWARMYEHVKKSERAQGSSADRAEEIAARTVNKERARSGKTPPGSRAATSPRAGAVGSVPGTAPAGALVISSTRRRRRRASRVARG